MDKLPATALSVVVPYFRKLTELRAVLPYNARYLGRPDVELVLVLDEPSQEAEVLSLLDRLPLVRARVVVNDRPHDWRPPCVAINVGLRAASGKFVLVASPESLFVGDVPSRVLQVLSARPGDVVVGRIGWVTLAAARRKNPEALFQMAIAAQNMPGFAANYYGSIAAARDLFIAVRGYDESLSEWGGDDDNMRARLSMQGAMLMLDRGLKLIHLSEGAPKSNRWQEGTIRARQREMFELFNPPSAEANPEQWGVEFGRVARDWRDAAPPPSVAGGGARSEPARRQRLTLGTTGRKSSGRPDVVAVFSFRYDAHLVDDLIANLRPIVDGWIAYDDRDSEALFSEEVARRRLLLREAHRLGARWVLAIDPDERVEHGLAGKIDELTRSMEPICWSFTLREMYEADRYRVDGVWGTKLQSRLFPLRGDLVLPPSKLHGRWCAFPARPSGFNLYHLKMIAPRRRKLRSALYSHLDPDRRFQQLGYDYLADEAGAVLEAVPPGREYFPAHRDDNGLWMPELPASETEGE
jgi:hypothetical protein